MPNRRLVFPAPSIVIGVGRFGLAVLERLGEDWQQLRLAGADCSLNNLRLMHISAGDEPESAWRREEVATLRVAGHVEDGDWPSLSLDFMILRSLGLIRFFHGTYQVAIPRDHGAIRISDLLGPTDDEKEPPSAAARGDERSDEANRFVRRRYFDWQSLDSDPLRAAEELRRQAEDRSSLHLFIMPIVNRIRQGNSPKVLFSVILRCHALAKGRDPSPWSGLHEVALHGEGASTGIVAKAEIDKVGRRWRRNDLLLDGLAAAPGPLHRGADREELHLPTPFRPNATDPKSPIDPFHLLGEDWEASGWATDLSDEERAFKALRVSHFRLGLFDHSPDQDAVHGQEFGDRLRLLGMLLHRGLVRLWVDLGRDQVEEHPPTSISRRKFLSEEAFEQSLGMLHALLVKPLEEEETGPKDVVEPPVEATPHPEIPTRFLRSLKLQPDPDQAAAHVLERRLAALGLMDPDHPPKSPNPLLEEVVLTLPAAESVGGESPPGRQRLRKVLNEVTRRLLDFSFLATYRKRPTRTPPRLTVFVVGDMAEPFTRIKTTEVLQEVHSELLRSFSSMFELHREGFDRALSVVPILSMPHPADPFGGEPLEPTRLEEAVIIDAVHRVRHWVESVLPGARRRISQIFIGGRVTDNAVLKPQDMVSQTRDFLSFLIRNDLAQDEWLRRAAVGPGGDDFFASFACREIEFPAEKAREYLANRLVRDCLRQLRTETRWQAPEAVEIPSASAEETLVEDAVKGLVGETEMAADAIAAEVRSALADSNGSRCTPQSELFDAFDERLERRVWSGISKLWQRLTQERGRIDELADHLRHRVSSELRSALPEIRRVADAEIASVSGLGLSAVLGRLSERRRLAHSQLQETERTRREWEAHCGQHTIPRKDRLTRAREQVTRCIARKPDCKPQRVGVLAWMITTPAASAFMTPVLVPWVGPAVATLLSGVGLTAAAALLLWRYSRRAGDELDTAIEQFKETITEMITGGEYDASVQDQTPSIRSFFEMRLRLTAALARRSYSLHTFEQAALDDGLARRLRESLDIQEHAMTRHAEKLGVRPAPSDSEGEDDLRSLFVRRVGENAEKLIDPEQLVALYRSRQRRDYLPVTDFVNSAGGIAEWRRTACLSNTSAVMEFGRHQFAFVATSPIAELDYFSDSVGEQLRRFVRRYYSNLGFGAKFLGYEGLDPDGLRLAIDAGLIADSALIQTYRRAEERAEEQAELDDSTYSRPRTLDCREYRVRPNAAYMMSLVQGVRPHSIHNLKRFESFHDRAAESAGGPQPVGPWTPFANCGKELLHHVRQNEAALNGSTHHESIDGRPGTSGKTHGTS